MVELETCTQDITGASVQEAAVHWWLQNVGLRWELVTSAEPRMAAAVVLLLTLGAVCGLPQPVNLVAAELMDAALLPVIRHLSSSSAENKVTEAELEKSTPQPSSLFSSLLQPSDTPDQMMIPDTKSITIGVWEKPCRFYLVHRQGRCVSRFSGFFGWTMNKKRGRYHQNFQQGNLFYFIIYTYLLRPYLWHLKFWP